MLNIKSFADRHVRYILHKRSCKIDPDHNYIDQNELRGLDHFFHCHSSGVCRRVSHFFRLFSTQRAQSLVFRSGAQQEYTDKRNHQTNTPDQEISVPESICGNPLSAERGEDCSSDPCAGSRDSDGKAQIRLKPVIQHDGNQKITNKG